MLLSNSGNIIAEVSGLLVGLVLNMLSCDYRLKSADQGAMVGDGFTYPSSSNLAFLRNLSQGWWFELQKGESTVIHSADTADINKARP